jgi:type 1 glutamine amidotransferase
MHRPLIALLCVLTSLVQAELTAEQLTVPLEVQPPTPDLVKIVLIAGAPSNKPGQHEYFAGCHLLAQCLKQTPGVWPVMVANGWPQNPAVLQGARCIVAYQDAGEKLAWAAPERWALMKQAIDAGAGLVAMHQAVEVPDAQTVEFQSWLGAAWQKDIGSRGHWDMSFTTIPQHQVTRGVLPFAAPKDGWLYNLHFLPGTVPLLQGLVPDKHRSTADAKSHAGREEVIAWAYERPDHGRSVGFTGADLHSGWRDPNQRRMVINAILWSARLSVPASGAPVDLPDSAFTFALDRKLLITQPKAK